MTSFKKDPFLLFKLLQVERENYTNGINLFGKSLKSISSLKNVSALTAKLLDEFEEAASRPEFVIRCQFCQLGFRAKLFHKSYTISSIEINILHL